MRSGIQWIKIQLKDRKFCTLIAAGGVTAILLSMEFFSVFIQHSENIPISGSDLCDVYHCLD